MSLRPLLSALVTWEWLLLVAILPFAATGSPRFAPVLLLIPLLWLARRAACGHFVPPTPLDWSVFLLLLMVLVSLYATFDIAFSYAKIAGMVYGVAVFYGAAAAAGRSARALWLGVGLLLASGWGVVGLGVLGVTWSRKVPLLGPLTARLPQRILSLPGRDAGFNPNEIAGVLLWMVPVALVLLAALLRRRRDLAGRLPRWQATVVFAGLPLTALTLTTMLLLTQSRAAWLGSAVAVAFVLLVVAGRYRRPLLLLLLVLLVAAAAAVYTAGVEQTVDLLLAQVGAATAEGSSALNTLAGRQEMWTRALYGIQDFPFTGMGMNNFRRVVHVLYPLFLISPDTDIAHAHNHLLQTALDLGIPGLIAYLAIWIGAGAILWQSWQLTTSPWRRALALGFAASLLGYFVYGLLDAVALGARPGFIFWLLLGLIVALSRRPAPAGAQLN